MGALASDAALMRIELRVEDGDPPEGEVWSEGHPAQPFSGWLDLLRILADLVQLPAPREALSGDAPAQPDEPPRPPAGPSS